MITLDYETFYDRKQGYSLKNKNVGLSTEDYVADPRFEEILVSAKIDGKPTEWFSGTFEETDAWLHALDIPSAALLCQNTRFDGTILAMKHGIYPKFYLDTLAMATPFFKPLLKSLSLGSLVEYLELGVKGDEVVRAEGKRRCDFTPFELEQYANYCMTDTELTYKLYKHLVRLYPANALKNELRLIDMTIRMYTQPTLELAAPVYVKELDRIQTRKAKTIADMELRGITKKDLGSGVKFAQILRDRGIEPPLKQSPASLKRGDNPVQMTYAFGKSDPEFIELQEEFVDDDEVSAILAARTETKSTQGETRCKKFITKAQGHTVLRVPVGYYGAHTGRYVGTDGENWLNLPNVGEYTDKDTGQKAFKSMLRFGIVAPEDHVVYAADLSQIECRITAALAGQDDLLEEFRTGGDPYSTCASGLFRREVSKALAKVNPQAEKDRKCGKEIILGCGFGMGWRKFQRSTRVKGLNLTDEEAEQYVGYYRDRYSMVPVGWQTLDAALRTLVFQREETQVGPVRFKWLDKRDAAIELPNGMCLLYPKLRTMKDKFDKTQIVCQHARDKFPRKLWGGVIMENLAQSLARIIIVDNMLAVHQELGYRTALQVYDEVVFPVHKDAVAEVKPKVEAIMSRSPIWMPDLPVGVESKAGPSFGDV